MVKSAWTSLILNLQAQEQVKIAVNCMQNLTTDVQWRPVVCARLRFEG